MPSRYIIPTTPGLAFGTHNPTRGVLCPCLACSFRPSQPRTADADPYLDGDYDLIDTRRRYEFGE